MEQIVTMPVGALGLSSQLQDGVITLWVLCESKAQMEERTIYIVGTGNPMPVSVVNFIDSVQQFPYVWHIFIEVK